MILFLCFCVIFCCCHLLLLLLLYIFNAIYRFYTSINSLPFPTIPAGESVDIISDVLNEIMIVWINVLETTYVCVHLNYLHNRNKPSTHNATIHLHSPWRIHHHWNAVALGVCYFSCWCHASMRYNACITFNKYFYR